MKVLFLLSLQTQIVVLLKTHITPSVKLSNIPDLEKKILYCVLSGITTEVKLVAVDKLHQKDFVH